MNSERGCVLDESFACVFFGVFLALPQLFFGEEWEKITQAVEFQYFKKIKKNCQSDLQNPRRGVS